jgi:hypothetical protein
MFIAKYNYYKLSEFLGVTQTGFFLPSMTFSLPGDREC